MPANSWGFSAKLETRLSDASVSQTPRSAAGAHAAHARHPELPGPSTHSPVSRRGSASRAWPSLRDSSAAHRPSDTPDWDTLDGGCLDGAGSHTWRPVFRGQLSRYSLHTPTSFLFLLLLLLRVWQHQIVRMYVLWTRRKSAGCGPWPARTQTLSPPTSGSADPRSPRACSTSHLAPPATARRHPPAAPGAAGGHRQAFGTE